MSPTETRQATWRQLLAEQQASGQSIISWCSQHEISLATFYYRKKHLTNSVPAPSAPQWLDVTASTSSDPLVLHVGRVAIEISAGFDPRLLHDVLAVLEAR